MEAGWFEMLLFADIETISNICQSHQRANQICNDKHFWLEKFDYYGLKIMTTQNTSAGWIKEYSDILTAKINVDIMIHNIENNIVKYKPLIEEIIYHIYLDQIINYITNTIEKFDTILYETTNNKIVFGNPIALQITVNDNRLLIGYVILKITKIEKFKELLLDIYYYMYKTNIKINTSGIVKMNDFFQQNYYQFE